MKSLSPQRPFDAWRVLTRSATVGASLVWGLVELFALQRARLQRAVGGWRAAGK